MAPALPRVRARRIAAIALTAALAAGLSGCGSTPKVDRQAALRQAQPASVLVLPPLNDSPEVRAGAAVLAQVSLPLAEAGYYVLPVTLVQQTFRENGLTTAHDIHEVAPQRLRDIFGADAALYLRITDYGTRYLIVRSQTRVALQARLVDLRSGALLWSGEAAADNLEGESGQGNLLGKMVGAVLSQVFDEVSDASYGQAGVAAQRLLGVPRPDGLLYGPRSRHFRKDR